MQTYTHLLGIGPALAITVFPSDFAAQAGCILASAGPDGGFAMQYAIDRWAGKKLLHDLHRSVRLYGEFFHSFIVWFAFAATLYGTWHLLPNEISTFLIGGVVGWIGHIVTDILTHGGDRSEHGEMLARTDVSYLWPLNYIHPALAIHLRVWEYRYDHGILWPLKPPELCVLLFTMTYAISYYTTTLVVSFLRT